MDSEFKKILSQVNTSPIQYHLADRIKRLLSIGSYDLTNYLLIEQKLGRKLTNEEEYILRNLSRLSNCGSGAIVKI